MQRWQFPPHPHLIFLFYRRHVSLGEYWLITINWMKWWLQLQLLYQWDFYELWGIQISLLRWRISCYMWLSLQPLTQRGTFHSGSLWILEAAWSSHWYVTLANFLRNLKTSFEWAQKKRKLCTKSRLLLRLFCHWGHASQQILWYSNCQWQIRRMFEVCGRAPYMNPEQGSLDVWSKTQLLPDNNCSLFEK